MSRIASLNDQLRSSLDQRFGAIFLSHAVASTGLAVQMSVREAVKTYSAFTPENDPNGEHDFGEFEVGDERYCWKIDCRDSAPEQKPAGSPYLGGKPRTLMIMFADEYWQLKSEQLCL
jgi:hypothetical protein